MAPQTANSRRKTRCKACNWRGLKSRHDLVRMRKADPFDPDFHLLEYLAKPRACVTSGRIVIWVYRDWSFIREIVLSGHAESRTCESVTSILIEAIKKLEDDTQWMLTCGAAYFRLPPNHNVGWTADFLDERHPQRILGEMMHNLQEFAGPNGLVEIIEQDWRDLVVFRDQFRQRAGASLDQIVLPDPNSPGRCADYLPVVPISDPDGKPLIFALEGWDFDCPGFQSVADKHLHRVQRGLLKDALRRRRVYRGWFKEWMEEWVPRLSWLPEREATQVKLTFPPPIKENEDDNT